MFAASGQLWKSKKQRCLSKLDSLFVLVQGQFIKSEPNKKVQLCKSIAVLVFSMNFLNELQILKFRFWNWSELQTLKHSEVPRPKLLVQPFDPKDLTSFLDRHLLSNHSPWTETL